MRVIKALHFGGTTISFIDPGYTGSWPLIRMQIINSQVNTTLDLPTEFMDDMRHALRQAARITRQREKQMGRR